MNNEITNNNSDATDIETIKSADPNVVDDQDFTAESADPNVVDDQDFTAESDDPDSVDNENDTEVSGEDSEGFVNVALSDEDIEEAVQEKKPRLVSSFVFIASFALLGVIAIVIILITVIKAGNKESTYKDSGTSSEALENPVAVPDNTSSDSTDTAAQNETYGSSVSEPIDFVDYGVKVTLADYKDLKLEIPEITVSEEDVDEHISSFVESLGLAGLREVSDRAAESGDTVVIDYDGIVDGEHHDSTTGTDYEIKIGSKRTITGFEDGIIGMKPGETKVLNLTFPDPYTNPDFAGKPVDFTITLKTLKEYYIPELTDEIVAENTEYKTVEEYRKFTRENLISEATEDAKETAFEDIIETLMNTSTFSDEIEKEIADRIEYYRTFYDNYFMQNFGMDALSYSSMTQEQYDGLLRNISEPEAMCPYIYREVAREEGYYPTDEEKAERFDKLFYDMYGFENEEQVYKTFTKKMCDATVEQDLLGEYGYNHLRQYFGLTA